MESSVLESGTIIDKRVEILSLAGEGSTSFVYRARHTRLDKDVAVKALHLSRVTDKASVLRFYREAKLVSSLDHPNIVRVLAVGLTRQQQPYFVMDFVEGRTLSDLIVNGEPKSLEQFLSIFVQVCGALEHAHSRGVVHRDVKPSNIVLVREGDTLRPKLVDFGIAKMSAQHEGEGQTTTLTAEGAIIGTPAYMSPEQCLGKPLDARSDIYSLGCVMYQAVTARLPFSGQIATAVVRQHLVEAPPAIKGQPTLFEVPDDLERVIEHALSKSTEDRYQSVAELLEDLRAIQNKQPVSVRRIPASKDSAGIEDKVRSLERFRKYATVLSAAVVTFLALFVFAVTMNGGNSQSKEALRLQAQLFKNKGLQVREHDTRSAIGYYKQAYDVYNKIGERSRDFGNLCLELAYAEEASDDPLLQEEADHYFVQALDVLGHSGSDRKKLADIYMRWGRALFSRRHYAPAISRLKQAMTYTESSNPDYTELVKILSCEVESYEALGRYAEAADAVRAIIKAEKDYGAAPDCVASWNTRLAELEKKAAFH